MANEHKRLGDMLLESGLITSEQLEQAIADQKKTARQLGATLVHNGVITETDLVQLLEQQLGLPVVDLDKVPAEEAAIARIKEEQARKYTALPIEIEGRKTLVVAMADPMNVHALEDLRFHSGMFIKPVLAVPSQLLEAIERYYRTDNSANEVIQSIIENESEVVVNAVEERDERQAIDEMMREAEGRPIVRLTNWLLHRAVEERASDIHLEPQVADLIVRFRVDGLLREEQRLPKWTQSAVVSRIKVLANLDIAEKRLPQDGRLVAEIEGRRVEMRVSTLPMTTGEKVVMRVVDQSRTRIDLGTMGMEDRDLARMKRFLERPQGIVLVTGPTGSGKSTLLYSALRHVQAVTRNITTVEDPVEFQIPGINQVQVDEKAKKTYASVLRSILRQDPDIVMIGEIRDRETAQIAFRAAITGHLVLSTIHTNDAAGAVTRLVDLGLEPFMVATALVGVVSIRLVRTLCPKCKESYETDASAVTLLGGHAAGSLELWRAPGCPNCRESGFSGRTGIFEVLEVDETIRRLIAQNAPDHEIRRAAMDAGMRPIGQDGLSKAKAGRTTLDEVMRVVHLGDEGLKMCGACSETMPKEFEYCPQCGAYAGEHCEKCRRRVQPDWKHCPHCGTTSRVQRATRVERPRTSAMMPRPSSIAPRPSNLTPRPSSLTRTKKAS